MIIFSKKWKNFNKIQLTKKQIGLEQSKNHKSPVTKFVINFNFAVFHSK